ncbi:hypothetical protein [Aquimarina aggregata]|uniref:hypothetical protein n=1 Tax=Aquimarina aggregata TaxID=1642818 RepID=UPI002492F66F|nr:hypothetical protein [Aquimarina aggregata]
MKTYFELNKETEKLLKQVNLKRYSVESEENLAVLETNSARCFIDKGITHYKFSLSEKSLITPRKFTTISPERTQVYAEWYTSEEANQKGIKRNAHETANIFDGMGVILVPDDFKIPIMVATEENVKFYGLKLIPDGKSFCVSSLITETVLMEYDYKPNYVKDFLTKEHGGGGYYVEIHDFPHIHIPLNSSSKGSIIIGKRISESQYCFTAFKIPFKYALYSPPGTIHGDGTLVGKYGISVASSKTSANTVLFFNKDTLTKMDDIV